MSQPGVYFFYIFMLLLFIRTIVSFDAARAVFGYPPIDGVNARTSNGKHSENSEIDKCQFSLCNTAFVYFKEGNAHGYNHWNQCHSEE